MKSTLTQWEIAALMMSVARNNTLDTSSAEKLIEKLVFANKIVVDWTRGP